MKHIESSQPVVMIHGAFCGGWAFERWQAPFSSAGYDVHTPTLRHHHRAGHAPDALATTSMRDYVGDLETLIDGLDRPPVLVGHSMGGLLAQLVAARRPVRALVLLAPCAPWGVFPATPFEVASANALYMTGDFWNRSLHPEPWLAAANALDNVPEKEQASVLKRFVPESGRATFEIMHWGFDTTRATHFEPADVTCPVLCIAGARDRVNSPGTVRSVARRYRGQAAYEELRGHSHWLIGEPGWEKIAARALDWLKSA